MPYTKSSTIKKRFYRRFANVVPISQPSQESVTTVSYDRTLNGNYLPNWRKVIMDGGNATTALSATINEAQHNGCSMTATGYYRISAFAPWVLSRSEDSSFYNFSSLAPLAPFTGSADQEASDLALKRLYQEINKAHHELQGGVVLGEIKKTGAMLASTAARLKRGVLNYLSTAVSIRNGRGSRKLKRQKIAGTYLETVFGWQPLIHDCKDFATTLARLCFEKDRALVRAYAECTNPIAQTETRIQYGHLVAIQTKSDSFTVRRIYRGFLQTLPYEAGHPPAERIISLSGFDLRSFIPTMWELLPYSFLIDYFTNIGDCLQALSADTDSVKSLWLTIVKQSTREYRQVPDIAYSTQLFKNDPTLYKGWIVFGTAGQSSVWLRSVTRSALTQVPWMVPRLKGANLPWKQFANIGALLLSRS